MNLTMEMVKALQKEHGDAFYLLDSALFQRNYLEMKREFSSLYANFNIAYSYKTNYTPKLCKLVDSMGGYAEVVSEMELELAERLGVRPEKIIWNGPVKSRDVMERLLLSGGTVNLDSMEDLRLAAGIAACHIGQKMNVGIRCNYDVGDGVVSRFGFDVDGGDFEEAMDVIQKSDVLHLKNFQCHFARRQLAYWPARVRGMLALLDRLGLVPDRIDLGGGMYGNMPEDLQKQLGGNIPSYRDYAGVAAGMFAEKFAKAEFKPELVVEPGSALVGDCMKFVATVKSIKSVRGKVFATLLGSQKNISMSGVNPPIEVLNMGNDGRYYSDVTMTGYTCIESDVLVTGYNGYLSVGDAVIFSNCGSYSLVMKPPFILPNFPVLDIGSGAWEVVKECENFDDIFHTFSF